jgi:hypothetical protein
MKRFIALLLVGVMALSLAGCGKPAGMNQEIYDYGQEAVKVTESYLNGGMAAETAYDRLDFVYDKMNAVATTPKDLNARFDDDLVRSTVLILSSKFLSVLSSSDSDKDALDAEIKESLEDLKKYLKG